LTIGTDKFPVGKLKIKAHVPCAKPASITVSEEPSGEWFVSFCCELPAMEFKAPDQEETIVRTQEELKYEFALRRDLSSIVVGLDRGVAIPLASSTGKTFDIPAVNRVRITKKERFIKRFQKRMSRQTKGSRSYKKNRLKVAKLKGYAANVRKDFAHKTSFSLVKSEAQVFAFEDLKLKNMTASPAAKQDAKGRYIRNGAAAKAGLSKALLSSALGLVKQFTGYKAAAANKLVLSVPAHYSSQECSNCGHIDSANRMTQSLFKCEACNHSENADINASKVIKGRGIKALTKHLAEVQAGTVKIKIMKKVGFRRPKDQKVGLVKSEPKAEIPLSALVESTSDAANDPFVYGAMLVEARNPHLGRRPGGG
jgi:putative transposase